MNTTFVPPNIIRVIISLILSLTVWVGYAQEYEEEYYTEEKEEQTFNDKIFFGGNFALAVGSVESYIEISPLIGYRFTDKFSMGTGPIYQYYSNSRYNLSLNIFGGRVYGRYIIYNNIFAHVEEQLTFNDYNFKYGTKESNTSKTVNDLLVGGGLRLPLGKRSSINLVMLYNLTESEFSTYSNPVVRVDFNF